MLQRRPVVGTFARFPSGTGNLMDRLPEEVVLHILYFLDTADIVSIQLVSSRYLSLARDNALWKTECFTHSRTEALRRRHHLLNLQDPRLAEIRNALSALPGGDLTAADVSQLTGRGSERASPGPAAEARTQRSRALASWEPCYPNERLDYYNEFIHRHGAIKVGWLKLPGAKTSGRECPREATGIGMLSDHQDHSIQRAVAPLDDGSVCIWNLSARRTESNGGGGHIIAKTKPGLLTECTVGAKADNHAIMTESGAVECVSIDSSSTRAYFAVQNRLHEVDLNTLQVASTKQYPFPITALSDTNSGIPLTVGTNLTIHLYDPRDPAFAAAETSTAGELIGGSIYSHATLAQPGPLSILNSTEFDNHGSSIWIAGRFTSLLNYDRRFFPRLRGTIHSGARIASLSSIPYPYIPRSLDVLRQPDATLAALYNAKSEPGTTILAAAEYKGKGSLELYGLPGPNLYQNRQTASASKLLSVAPHGGRIVISDGDGNLKWMERDGFTYVRTFNINNQLPRADTRDPMAQGIWASSGSEAPGHGDLVQKIIPTNVSPAGSAISASFGRMDVNSSNLMLWTGDGRLGLLGFGPNNPLGEEEWYDTVEEQCKSVEQRAREDAERQYGMAMRRALERNADEVRFVRGLGMGR